MGTGTCALGETWKDDRNPTKRQALQDEDGPAAETGLAPPPLTPRCRSLGRLTSGSSAVIFDVYVLLSMKVVKLSAAPTVPQEATVL